MTVWNLSARCTENGPGSQEITDVLPLTNDLRFSLKAHELGKKLPPEQKELYRRTDEVLHYLWDPIGVAGSRVPAINKSTTLPRVFSLLTKGADKPEIADYLTTVVRDSMGLNADTTKALRIAEILIDYRTWISDRPS